MQLLLKVPILSPQKLFFPFRSSRILALMVFLTFMSDSLETFVAKTHI